MLGKAAWHWDKRGVRGDGRESELGQVCCVERRRRRKGRETVERVYAPTTLPPERAEAARLLAALRNLATGMLRLCGAKDISAALHHYSRKPWETLTLIALPLNN